MKHVQRLTIVSFLMLAFGSLNPLRAADSVPTEKTNEIHAGDQIAQKRIDAKADHLLAAIKLDNPAKAARVKTVMGTWLVTMGNWHQQHDPELNELWAQWNKARSASPNDEFPGERVFQQIKDVYASLKPAYDLLTRKMASELTPEQIDAIKESWSRKPGMTRTYNAYLQIVPDLADDQKKVIHDQLLSAREDAMLTDYDREIVNIYKCHKIKVQAYIGALEWHKLYSAFVHRAANH